MAVVVVNLKVCHSRFFFAQENFSTLQTKCFNFFVESPTFGCGENEIVRNDVDELLPNMKAFCVSVKLNLGKLLGNFFPCEKLIRLEKVAAYVNTKQTTTTKPSG